MGQVLRLRGFLCRFCELRNGLASKPPVRAWLGFFGCRKISRSGTCAIMSFKLLSNEGWNARRPWGTTRNRILLSKWIFDFWWLKRNHNLFISEIFSVDKRCAICCFFGYISQKSWNRVVEDLEGSQLYMVCEGSVLVRTLHRRRLQVIRIEGSSWNDSSGVLTIRVHRT